MSRKSTRVMLMGCLLFVLLFVASCGGPLATAVEGETRQMTATYLGQPEILRSGETVWQPLEYGAVINIGDSIRAGADTWVYLTINDGSLVGLTPNTQATLVTFSSAMADPVTLFDLAEGLVYVRVTKELGNGSFKVRTPVMTGSVVGSKMSVSFIPSMNIAEVACFDGNVTADIDYDPQQDPLSCNIMTGIKLSANSQDEWSVTKCQNPVRVQRQELDEYSDWEQIYVDIYYMRETELAEYATQTRIARFTKTPTATEPPLPTDTPTPVYTPTITFTPAPVRYATVTASAELSGAEQANSGTHDYSFTATYSGNCTGPASGEIGQMQITFAGNQVTLGAGGNQTIFTKIDENTYQGVDGDDVVVMTFNDSGFSGTSQCGTWVYTRK